MVKKLWRYLANVFDIATRFSYKKMFLLITDSTTKLQSLKSDPDIDALYQRTEPVCTGYSLAYSDWTSAKGKREGETVRFTGKMAELTDLKAKQWEAQVRAVYLEDTADYKKIFPDGRSMFREGPYDIRINHLQALGSTLADYPALATTKADVDHFHQDILTIRNVQTQHEEKVKAASDLLEQKRLNASGMLFGNLGVLMDKYKDNPLLVEKYFDLSLLRSYSNGNGGTPEPEPVTGMVAALNSVTLMEGGFDANTMFSLANIGGTTLRFYTAKLPTDPVPGTTVELLPGEDAEVFASDLGADTNLFLMVFNPDELNDGEYSYLVMDQTEE